MLSVLAALPPVQVRAAGGNGIRLDEKGTVTVVSPYAAQEEIFSLGFCLSVESPPTAAAEFQFEENAAEILEFRYDKDTKKLNIYMSGRSALFAEGADSLTIGRVIVRDDSGRETTARVSVVKDSLQYVNGMELMTMEDVELPGTVQIGSVSGTAPAVTPAVTQAPEDEEDSQEDPETQSPAVTPARPPVQASGTVSRPQATKEPSRPQNSGGAPGGSGSLSQTTGGKPGPTENSLPENTPEKDEDEFIFSGSPEKEDTGQTLESKGFNVIMVIAVIVIVIVVIVEIVAFAVVKKKPKNK